MEMEINGNQIIFTTINEAGCCSVCGDKVTTMPDNKYFDFDFQVILDSVDEDKVNFGSIIRSKIINEWLKGGICKGCTTSMSSLLPKLHKQYTFKTTQDLQIGFLEFLNKRIKTLTNKKEQK